jgi:hypothetical protein
MDGKKAKIIVDRLMRLTENEEIVWVAWSSGEFYYGWDKENPNGSIVITIDGSVVMRGETVGAEYRVISAPVNGGYDLYQVVARKTQAIALRQKLEGEATQARKEVVAQNALLEHLRTLEVK